MGQCTQLTENNKEVEYHTVIEGIQTARLSCSRRGQLLSPRLSIRPGFTPRSGKVNPLRTYTRVGRLLIPGVHSSQNLSPMYMTAASEGGSDFAAQQATGRSNAGAGLPGSYTASLASPSTTPRKMRNAETGIEDLMVHQDSTGAIRCGIDVSCLAVVLMEVRTRLMTCSPTPSPAGGFQACHEPGRGLSVSHIPPNSLLLTTPLSSTQISR
jgi:hypothetical protein